jgi:hypothetical protein
MNIIKAFTGQKPIVIYPIYLDLTGDYATAAALGQVLYWHELMNGKFYKIDADFEKELHLTPKQFRRVKTLLKTLPFLTIKSEGNPAKTYYDVDYDALVLTIQSTQKEQIKEQKSAQKGETRPAQKGETRPAQKGETRPAQKGETRPAQKGETLYTENKQRLPETTTEIAVAAAVVLNELEMKVFAWASAHSYWAQFTVTKETFLKTLHKPSGAMMAQYEMAIANQSKIVIDRKFIEKHAKTHETYSQAENRLKEKFANGCQPYEAAVEVTVIQEKNKSDLEIVNLKNSIKNLEFMNKLSPNPELIKQIEQLKQQLMKEFKMKS